VAERVEAEGGIPVIGARSVGIDVTVEEQAAALVETALRDHGRLDGAFNNAGTVEARGPLAELDAAVWRADLDQNLTSVFYCLKAQIPAIGAGGSIVNNASIAGVRGVPGLASYTAAKHGVIGLTRAAALECARRGPRVNAIVTGNVDTPLYRSLLDAPEDRPRDELDAPNPTGRVAGPEEIAAFVAYLLSDEAAFITGAALAIDGGATAAP
jgi:NAD(P)-dependent dehydrogenase (short-subunit alcohol dehydrogenase family)